jgi:uncharacterized protein (TIGR03435 family)
MSQSKIKIAMLVGAVIVLAAWTTTAVLTRLRMRTAIDDSIWDVKNHNPEKGNNLDNAAPGIVIIRPTHFAGGDQGGIGSMTGRIGGRNTTFENIICAAYGISGSRIIYAAPVPGGRFDYAVTLTNQPGDKLQAAIKREFGLAAHREIRETDVLLLKTNASNSSKMKPSSATDGVMGFGPRQLVFSNQPISLLRGDLEVWAYRLPVLDQTGLMERYDFVLDWPPPMGYVDETGQKALRENLRRELGLELVPGREPVEMLVVEKAR